MGFLIPLPVGLRHLGQYAGDRPRTRALLRRLGKDTDEVEWEGMSLGSESSKMMLLDEEWEQTLDTESADGLFSL